ncbi:MAG: immunogenic protein [Ruminococcaceae bacterium]|nr:immunogenic protein [Oscillospiraceae bacterium]
MKRLITLTVALLLIFILIGCNNTPKPVKTVEGNINTYHKMSDGTWQYDGHTYQYRLELSGRMPNADKDTVYVILSNSDDITFEEAIMASGFGSHTDSYFEVEDAVFVEIN